MFDLTVERPGPFLVPAAALQVVRWPVGWWPGAFVPGALVGVRGLLGGCLMLSVLLSAAIWLAWIWLAVTLAVGVLCLWWLLAGEGADPLGGPVVARTPEELEAVYEASPDWRVTG